MDRMHGMSCVMGLDWIELNGLWLVRDGIFSLALMEREEKGRGKAWRKEME